jgi:hypothetical protein
MDRQFVFRIFDKGISLLVFIFLLKSIVPYGADITLLFWGAIFGFTISLNQDLRLKNSFLAGIQIGNEIFLSVHLNNIVFIILLLFSNLSIINIVLFYFTSSGRLDILKYESKFKSAQFQTLIAILISFSAYMVTFLHTSDSYFYSLITFMLVKSVVGEIYLTSLMTGLRVTKLPKIDIHLALSGTLVVSVGYVIPTIAAYFVADPSKLLYHIAAIQRSLSPSQQLGTIYSRNYKHISEVLIKIKYFSFLSVALAISIYTYLMAPAINFEIVALIAVISCYATISGSWTIKMIAQGRESIEMLKTLVAIVLSILLTPVLMFAPLSEGDLVVSVYVVYLFLLYIPFIHFYR